TIRSNLARLLGLLRRDRFRSPNAGRPSRRERHGADGKIVNRRLAVVSPADGAWSRRARSQLPAMRAWRAAFHREPELAYHETRTRAKIVEGLEGLGIPFRTFEGSTAVVALLGRDRTGPVVALRADMDALPVTEQTGLPFASTVAGRMHACGHDVHMSCLLGAAALLRREEGRLRGPVKLLFQPAEEDGRRGGALPLIENGALENPRVDYVVGQHVEPRIPAGRVGWKTGPIHAAADRFTVRVRGTPGHAASPHQGPDAILVAAEIVNGLQALVSRVKDPVDPVVISVGMIHGGSRHNILPAEVVLDGTIRTLKPATRETIHLVLKRRINRLAQSLGARALVRIERGYPVTMNTEGATHIVVGSLAKEFGTDRLVALQESYMGAEDFSRYLEKVPGTFLELGAGIPGRPESLHTPTFAPPDQTLVIGAASFAASVEGLQQAR
ncbi:MAG: M20 family metallopeptidase, partial [Thermoplasmata archaeon]